MRSIEMIPVDRIQILNPRRRNERQYRSIVENIDKIGLKRPITVSRHLPCDDEFDYDLVCGQGRLEAYKRLDRESIPAVIVEADEHECLVMSLVENIARRQHPAIELMKEIGVLHERGYSEAQIAKKIGVTTSWVGMLLGLLERGEERLVAAVERGIVPISMAVTISRSDDVGVQQALTEAYMQGVVKGRKLSLLKKTLEQRPLRGKGEPASGAGKRGGRKFDADHLRRIYQQEVGKQQLLMKKADFTQKRLLFVIQAMQSLLRNSEFVGLLKSEGIATIPAALEGRIMRGGHS